jgi:hypothetical protein
VIRQTVGKNETTVILNTIKVVMKTPVCWDMTSHSGFVRSVEPLGRKAYQMNGKKSDYLAISEKISVATTKQLQLSGAVAAACGSYSCLGQLQLFRAVTAVWGS